MKQKAISILYLIGAIFFIAALIGIVGRMEAEDEEASFKQYCVDVSNGIHPDYKKQLDYCDR